MWFLTSQERGVLVFLSAVLIVGITISAARKVCLPLDAALRIDRNAARMDINRADCDDLAAVKAVPEKVARAIIAFRERRGRLHDLDELKEIKGVGEKRIKKLENYFYAE